VTLNQTLDLLLEANRLKITPRSGWAIRGVVRPENVAAHSYGVAFLSLILAEAVEEELDAPLDRAKLLTIALLHDLPESRITDIPYPALRFLTPGAKRGAEEQALDEMLGALPFAGAYRHLWRDFEDRRTPEGRLVRDADRLELLIQAYVYERSTGNRLLGEFWEKIDETTFRYAASRALFAQLRGRRENEIAS
jgi:putative hydrolase of HD superfamily